MTNSGILLDCGPSLRGWSNQEDLLVCPYRWGRKNMVQDQIRVPSDPLVKGSLGHAGLAHFWSIRIAEMQGQKNHGLLDPSSAIATLAAQEDHKIAAVRGYGNVWQPHVLLAQQMVEKYASVDPYRMLRPIAVEYHVSLWVDRDSSGRWAFGAPPWDATEREKLAREGRWAEFYARGAPWLSTFRADLIAQEPSGAFVVVDHKTGYKNDARKQQGFVSSGQMIQFQHWGQLAYGASWGGVHVAFINWREIGNASGASSRSSTSRAFESFRVASLPETVFDMPRQIAMRAESHARLMAVEPDWRMWPKALVESGSCAGKYGDCDLKVSCCGG